MKKSPTVVIVPGLRDHVEDHWQTHLERSLDNVLTVPPLEADKLSRDARVAALDEVLTSVSGPVVLVAHSAGVMTVAHWVKAHPREVAGALLVTPADLELPLPESYPSLEQLDRNGWLPIPRQRLPFPSTVAASRNDPLAGYRRVVGLAEGWGSRLLDLGDVGHLNPASGYGYWPRAESLVRELLEAVSQVDSEEQEEHSHA
ncbi:alpha/beta hydrolase [Rhodococcus erythropolis]|uniref:RBBP9/YdeN family alpha/beta hydrolase n=1 Tax=Rhodococcus erythropolis TaxID=1833 RepID=UPI00294A670C|nr:alpha/beta hydrolase [Rhodococcus erythropolis]MDV6274425.1 alpha/beta hydrolase [Rhodococcus erythropolis]